MSGDDAGGGPGAETIVAELRKMDNGVRGSLLASVDGRPLAHDALAPSTVEGTAAIAASAINLAQSLGELCGPGSFQHVVVQTSAGRVALFPVDENRLLAVLADPDLHERQLRSLSEDVAGVVTKLSPAVLTKDEDLADRNDHMLSEQQIVNVIEDIAADTPGFIAASLVDIDSGMTLGVYSKDPSFDLNQASAYNSEMVKQKLKIMSALRLDNQELEDMLLTLSEHIHLIRLISPTTFLYLAADRRATNLAIVRNAVSAHARELKA